MKKIGLATAAFLLSAVTFAQTTILVETMATPPIQNPDVKKQITDICHDIRVYDNQKATAKLAFLKGDFTTAKTDFAIAKTDKEDVKTCAMVLKNEGVDHPLKMACKEVKKEDNRMIMADIKKIIAEKAVEKQARRSGDTQAAQAAKNNVIACKKELKKDVSQARRDNRSYNIFLTL